MQGLPLAAASGGHSSSRCAGLSLSRPLLLRSTGSRCAGSVVVAHRSSCSAACGIFLDQGSNPCPLHWQADSQPLRHQGSPADGFLTTAPPGKSLQNSVTGKNFSSLEDCKRHLEQFFAQKDEKFWETSLVAQWLRICLPMQGTRVRFLVQEDLTCRRASKPVRHNY